jgi:hypothetical protein
MRGTNRVTAYLTADRYRTMRFGTDLDIEDVELASVIARAGSLADAYCNVPMRPQRHSFLGGTISNEQHRWRLAQTPFETTQRRVYPYHTPILRCSQFRIYVTQPDPDIEDGQYVLVDPKDLMVNRVEDYIEVVSAAMTSTGLFNALIVPAIYLASPLATLDYTYGWDFTVTGERIYPTDGLTYQSQNNFWTTATVVVYGNDAVVTASDYTVDRSEGCIRFTSPPAIGASITVDYHHKLPVEIRDAIGYITTHLLEEASVTERGLAELQEIRIAEVTLRRMPEESNKGSARGYISQKVPEAAILLDDFSNWRVAI